MCTFLFILFFSLSSSLFTFSPIILFFILFFFTVHITIHSIYILNPYGLFFVHSSISFIPFCSHIALVLFPSLPYLLYSFIIFLILFSFFIFFVLRIFFYLDLNYLFVPSNFSFFHPLFIADILLVLLFYPLNCLV